MTWTDFTTAVKEEVPIEARRVGTENLFDRSLRAAAADLQSFLPWLREGHGDEYAADATVLVTDGMAMHLPAPAGKVSEVWLLHANADEERPGSTNRTQLIRRRWSWKFEMVAGLESGLGSWMLSPDLIELWFAPKLITGQRLQVVWAGIRDFTPAMGDVVLGTHWGNQGISLAASHYIRERYSQLVDHDQAAAQAHASAYARLRQRLYADFKERSL